MRDLLVDPAVTAAVLVSLPEELPVNETLELCAALKAKVKIHPATVVLNGVYPPRFEASDLAALEKGSPLELLAAAHRERELQSTRAAERLVEGTGLPLLEFPRLFGQDFGPGAIAQLAGLLAPLLEKGR